MTESWNPKDLKRKEKGWEEEEEEEETEESWNQMSRLSWETKKIEWGVVPSFTKSRNPGILKIWNAKKWNQKKDEETEEEEEETEETVEEEEETEEMFEE